MESAQLTSSDLAMFARFGIDAGLLTRARIGRVTDDYARKAFGMTYTGDLGGIAFPYFPPINNGHSKDQRWMVRIRRDDPGLKDGKPDAKYICESGVTYKHLYFPPECEAILSNPMAPVILVEAEKSTLALWAWSERNNAGILPVGMGGCFGWTGKHGRDDKGPSIDLDYCNKREVIILLDSNSTKDQVRRARVRLAQELFSRECIVRIAELPAVAGLNGPDDAIALSGDQIIADVFKNARFFDEYAHEQLESQIQTCAERGGRVDADFIKHCEDLIASIPGDEDRDVVLTRFHKALKGTVSKQTIKDAVSRLRQEYAARKREIAEQARQGELKSLKVDAGTLIVDLEAYFRGRAHLPEGAPLALAYFSLNTWTFDLFDTTPYLNVESAVPGCGKTTVISLLRVCREALSATGLSEATMFRLVSDVRPTLLLDEAEFLEGKSERAQNIKAMAHVGYKVGAKVPRCEGDDHAIAWFDVYGPKLFAVIGGITGALLERSIVIHMEKKPGGVKLKTTRERQLERDAKPLRRRLEAYALQMRPALTDLYDREPDQGYWPNITDREAEIWGPLLIHARIIGTEAEARLLAACDALTRQKTDIQSGEYNQALTVELAEAIEQHDGERFTPADLLGVLNGTENWGAKLAKYKEDDAKSKSSAIGRFLKKFRLKSRDRGRTGLSSKATSYLRSEALAVLLPNTPINNAASAAHTAATSAASASDCKDSNLDSACGTVAVAADNAADLAADIPGQAEVFNFDPNDIEPDGEL